MGDLSPNFSRSEFACKCGCGFDDVRPELVELLETIRFTTGDVPLVITSGCRCPKHNAESGGVENSPHMRGSAADIAVTGGYRRWQVVRAAFRAHAQGIGIAKTFVHVDVDRTLTRPAVWTY